MDMCYITFRSVTLAQRAESILTREGYRCHLQRTPRWMEQRGCGYGLRIREQDVEDCVAILRLQNAKFSKVYRITGDGQGEEMAL